MRLLLDTQVVLWGLQTPQRLGRQARRAILDAEAAYTSVVTFIEVGIKHATGKLEPPPNLRASIPDERLLRIAPEHGLALGKLPLLHRDPFDRLLIAQARAEGLTVVTSDEVFTEYGVDVIDARR